MKILEKADIGYLELLFFTLGLLGIILSISLNKFDFIIPSIITFFFPFIYKTIKRQRELKEIEEKFPDFVEDLVEALRSGMSLPKALQHISNNDYGKLTPYVKSLSARIDWGVRIKEAFELFAEETGSSLIKRTITTIFEIEKAGGKIEDCLDAVVKSLLEIRKIKKEREAAVYQNILHCYIIFFFFLGVLIVVVKFLIPLLSGKMVLGTLQQFGMAGAVAGMFGGVQVNQTIFLHLALIQGFFAGLAIGKMSEGTIKAGLKHSLILVFIAFFVLKIFGF